MADKKVPDSSEERLLGFERRLSDLQKDLNSILWTVDMARGDIEKITNSLIKIEDKILASK